MAPERYSILHSIRPYVVYIPESVEHTNCKNTTKNSTNEEAEHTKTSLKNAEFHAKYFAHMGIFFFISNFYA